MNSRLPRPGVDALEPRLLLSGTTDLTANTLTVSGDDAANVIVVFYDPARASLVVDIDGEQTTFDLATVYFIRVQGGAGNDTLTAGTGVVATSLDGQDGDDTLVGGPGNDTLRGGKGSDLLDGGIGTDLVDYSARTVPMRLTLDGIANDGTDGGAEGDNILPSVENVGGGQGDDSIVGSTGSNELWGNNGNDTIRGLASDDSVRGGGGNDWLVGGNGDDTLFGGNGADTLSGAFGFDTADYGGRFQPLSLTIDDVANDGAAGENDDILFDTERLVAGASNDLLAGSGGNNYLLGNGGNDTLTGDAGNDTLDGGSGTDSITGGDGIDVATYAGRGAGVTMRNDGTPTSGGSTERDTINPDVENLTGGSGNDLIVGDNQNNVLSGWEGKDTIDGGAGNDTILGSLDDDLLTGGPGTDDIQGNGGNDTIQIADGEIDTLTGSYGEDSATVDSFDIVSNIDHVTIA